MSNPAAEFKIKNVCVLQHTEAEFLGLIEDHFEGRNIRFDYRRPFTVGGTVPDSTDGYDGLIILPGGPYGVVSGHLLPSFSAELRLSKMFIEAGLPIIGFGLGATILSIAAGGGADEADLDFRIEKANRVKESALDGKMPQSFPLAFYGRDQTVLPKSATVLAAGENEQPLVFSINNNCIGFAGHPGMKSGMAEDLIMEFAQTPPDTASTLGELRDAQFEIATSLSAMMKGMVEETGLM
ncbi:MAG: hypothetical protein L3J21_01615 [Devosiaceae bacterium]|nr:hypothetical protein [Devosiaceae bacterium]